MRVFSSSAISAKRYCFNEVSVPHPGAAAARNSARTASSVVTSTWVITYCRQIEVVIDERVDLVDARLRESHLEDTFVEQAVPTDLNVVRLVVLDYRAGLPVGAWSLAGVPVDPDEGNAERVHGIGGLEREMSLEPGTSRSTFRMTPCTGRGTIGRSRSALPKDVSRDCAAADQSSWARAASTRSATVDCSSAFAPPCAWPQARHRGPWLC